MSLAVVDDTYVDITFNKTLEDEFYFKLLSTLDSISKFPIIGLSLLNYYKVIRNSNNLKIASNLALVKTVQYAIAMIDKALNNQINVILHHKNFQTLEASWRNIFLLVEELQEFDNIKVKMLNISWDLLARDLQFNLEFDQSALFKKIYNNEFDEPGGEPFGLLIGDYTISHRAFSKDGINQIETLQNLSQVAAAAFVPIIMAANANLFGLDSFRELKPWIDLNKIFQQEEYRYFKKLRKTEDTRFVGLVLPKTVLRKPYNENDRNTYFCFEETITNQDDYLWGNASYNFASVVANCFGLNGWFIDIKGIKRDYIGKGMVTNVDKQSFGLDRLGLIAKPALETRISPTQEFSLYKEGFTSLTLCDYTSFLAFNNCISLHKPEIYDRSHANQNAELSSMLNYMLCVSRFAHYIKILIRDKIGSFISAYECENYLRTWLQNYTAIIEDLSETVQARYPLREANVHIKEQFNKPGSYYCIIYLRPQFEIEAFGINLTIARNMSFQNENH